MRVLFVGDIVGKAAVKTVETILPTLRGKRMIDFIIVNGENSSENNGITPEIAERLHFAGADVITTGNHAFRQKSSHAFFDDCEYLVRPANFPSNDPGMGFVFVGTAFGKVCVLNLAGKLFMDSDENPFFTADRILSKITADYIFVDFHAEATSEKRALGYFLDGRVSAVFGTHTHVQTSDEQILPLGTGYITDVGMVGGKNSVLGLRKEDAIRKFTSHIGVRYSQDENEIFFQSVLFDTDKKEIERINI
ncbi:MAG: TIGR00282 family metallophosphoesterase [Clostridiales bacterium]|nr:TIGR00282 family metallophosphoesterase [Clostridiales bacterium]